MSNSTVTPVSASFVRDWAVKSGLRSAESKVIGRLTDAEVAEFNRRHKTKSYTPAVKPPRTVAIKAGRKTLHVPSAEVRAAIGAGKRGRLSAAQHAAAAEYVIGLKA